MEFENIKKNNNNNQIDIFQIVILILSIYIIGALVATTFFKIPKEIANVIDYFDTIICIIFLFDFFYNLIKAENKLQFLKWGWIDLISSIPNLDLLRFGRLIRVLKIFRIFRAIKSANNIWKYVFEKKQKSAFTTAGLIAILMLSFSSISILQVEDTPDSNIKTAEDAIWWAFTTITTVGYGDKYPVTTEGRIIAIVLMTTGVGLFGVFSGFVASFFVEGNTSKK